MNLMQILSSATPILVASAIGVIALACFGFLKKKRKAATAIEAIAEENRAWQNVKALLSAALPHLITWAENQYLADAAGTLKMSAVVDEAIKLIPPALRGQVQLDWLRSFIEGHLADARGLWRATKVLYMDQVAGHDAEVAANDNITVTADPADFENSSALESGAPLGEAVDTDAG